MGKIKQKVYDWKNRLQDRHMLTLIIVLIAIIIGIGLYTYKNKWNIDKLQKMIIIWLFMS